MGDYGNYDLDKIYTTPKFPLGAKVEDQAGGVYIFVKYNAGDGAVDAVAGRLAIGLDSGYPDNEVTMDYSSSTITAIPKNPKGFFQAALTDGTYGFLQTRGRNRKDMLTDGGVTQGDELMKHATTDGAVDTHDDTARKTVAIALETDDASSLLQEGQADITIETK